MILIRLYISHLYWFFYNIQKSSQRSEATAALQGLKIQGAFELVVMDAGFQKLWPSP